MKKHVLLSLLSLLWLSLVSQAPARFQYQAVVRDAQGNILANQPVSFRLSLHKSASTGSVEYAEAHTATTNDFGLVNLEVGGGTALTGNIAAIAWEQDLYFLEVEMDASGGSSYIPMGTTQLLSVPYSLSALKASNMTLNELTDVKGVPANGQVLKWNGTEWVPQNDNTGSTTYSAGPGISISGSNVISADLGTDIATSELQNAAVTTSKLATGAVTTAELANNAVTNSKMANNAVNTAELSNNAVTAPKLSQMGASAGEILKWNGSGWSPSPDDTGSGGTSLWQVAGSDIHFSTGRVGIGTSPISGFHVADNVPVLFGADTLGAGDKLLWIPRLHAFRVGSVATGSASTYWDPDSIGLYSFASGLNTRAQGFGATAMGRDSEASNSYAFASGYFTNADGQYSTAMGFNTDALALGSTALGYSTDAEENYSFAAGYFAEAQAIYSLALGNSVQAQSYSSMAVGRYNVGGGSATSWNATDPIFEIGIGTSSSNRANAVSVLKNGNVGIGTTTPLDALHVNGRVRFQSVEYFEDGGTNEIAARGDLRPTSDNTYDLGTSSFRWDDVYATNGTINTSDLRDKTNIRDLNYGLQTVLQLRPVRFNWKWDAENSDKLGLIAQELQIYIPEVVKSFDYQPDEESEKLVKEELDRLGVYYSDLIPVLIKAVQEQQELINSQQEQIDELKRRLSALE